MHRIKADGRGWLVIVGLVLAAVLGSGSDVTGEWWFWLLMGTAAVIAVAVSKPPGPRRSPVRILAALAHLRDRAASLRRVAQAGVTNTCELRHARARSAAGISLGPFSSGLPHPSNPDERNPRCTRS
jgi:hypothetical protein